jgi:type VI secretion system ImpB/VipA family protein
MTEGSQSTITGARLLYSIEAAGAEQLVSLPFVIGVLADFGGSAGRGVALEDRRLVDVSAARLDRVLKAWAPEVTIALAGDVAGTSGQTIVLRFRAIDDFRPAGVERLVAAALAESLASPPTAEQIAAVVDDRTSSLPLRTRSPSRCECCRSRRRSWQRAFAARPMPIGRSFSGRSTRMSSG